MRALGEVQSLREMSKLRIKNFRAELVRVRHDMDHPHLLDTEIAKFREEILSLRNQLAEKEKQLATAIERNNYEMLSKRHDELCDQIEAETAVLQDLNTEHNQIVSDRKTLTDNAEAVKEMQKLAKQLPQDVLKELLANLLKGNNDANASAAS